MEESRRGCCMVHQDASSNLYDFTAEVQFQERKILHARMSIVAAEQAIRDEEERRLERCLMKWRQESNEVMVEWDGRADATNVDALYGS